MHADKVSITAEDLQAELLRRRYVELLKNPDVFPSQKNWAYIISSKMGGEIAPLLYRKYLVSLATPTPDRVEHHLAAIREFPQYLAQLNFNDSIEAVYSDITTMPEESLKLIHRFNLFSAKKLLEIVESGNDIDFVISCLNVFKPEYTADDLGPMARLCEALDALPDKGYYDSARGMLRGVSTRYVCPNGHINNNPNDDYCSRPDCGLDVRGLTREQNAAIAAYEDILTVLTDMINQHS